MSEDSRKKENQIIKEWLRCVDGVIVGNKRKVTYKPIIFDPKYRNMDRWFEEDESQFECNVDMKDEDVCVLEIPRRYLLSMQETQEWYTKNASGMTVDRFDKIIRHHFEEKQIRETHPGVRESWEKYKIMLALASTTDFDDI